ncbi:hypothetical protein AURDEDRAFT_175572 [Auricularia subglabra TFB-10046 SS5]|uniref:Uncharacterized protein n=1 Tax=Auricularia subglabra (strain TFB-10046 / SS5) TaxID=717982 RepID=J0CXA8_AURST|nr:hypothetical protein AURDEDRAFT_175572 [Auricularia subglabra TFB-10046 SS5]
MVLKKVAKVASRAAISGAPAVRRAIQRRDANVSQMPEFPSFRHTDAEPPLFVMLESKQDFGRFFHELHARIPSTLGSYRATVIYMSDLYAILLDQTKYISPTELGDFPGVKSVEVADQVVYSYEHLPRRFPK